jgi:uncharacterized membrane protein
MMEGRPMMTSLVIAQILGPMYVVVAIGLMVNPSVYRDLFEAFVETPAAAYFAGIFALIFGLVILAFHFTWHADWTIVITIVGWLGFLKGCALIVFPAGTMRLYRPFMPGASTMRLWALGPLVLGAFLSAKGYQLF